jgi:hypothetical protein
MLSIENKFTRLSKDNTKEKTKDENKHKIILIIARSVPADTYSSY